MVEHLNAASNSHTEDILYVSQYEPSQSLVTCQVTQYRTFIATARVLPKATQRELFRLGAWPR